MHGMTAREVAEFKRMTAASRAAVTMDDAKAVKQMCAEWVRNAPSERAKMRRKNMIRAVRFSHSEFPE